MGRIFSVGLAGVFSPEPEEPAGGVAFRTTLTETKMAQIRFRCKANI